MSTEPPAEGTLVLRRPWVNVGNAAVGMLVSVMGLGDLADESPWWLGWTLVALGGWMVLSSCVAAVSVTADHVIVRSFLGWRRIPRSEIRAVSRTSAYLPRLWVPDVVAPTLVVGSRTVLLWPLAVSSVRPREVRMCTYWGKLLAWELGVRYKA